MNVEQETFNDNCIPNGKAVILKIGDKEFDVIISSGNVKFSVDRYHATEIRFIQYESPKLELITLTVESCDERLYHELFKNE
jgi:hypothetical protein